MFTSLFKMVLETEAAIHILLVGPPPSAKTKFLTSLLQLKNSYFSDGGASTKSGIIDYLFANRPRCLLVDEIDKMPAKDQTSLLNLMETSIVSETKYGKTRSAQIKTSAFATSNNIKKISAAQQSRFSIVELEPYTYEQFCEMATCHRYLDLDSTLCYNWPRRLSFQVYNASPAYCRNYGIYMVWFIPSPLVSVNRFLSMLFPPDFLRDSRHVAACHMQLQLGHLQPQDHSIWHFA